MMAAKLIGLICALAFTQAPDPTSRPAVKPGQPGPDLTAKQCLAIAHRYLDDDNYVMAGDYLKAARNRAKTREMRRTAMIELRRLKVLGDVATTFIAKEWLNGKPVKLSRIRGQVVLLCFFQATNDDSRHAVEHVMELAQRHGPAGLTTISFMVPDPDDLATNPKTLELYAKRFNHPVAVDENGAILAGYLGKETPYIVIIDRNRKVRWMRAWSLEGLEIKIRKLLAEKKGDRLPGRRIVMPQSRGGRDLIDTHAPRLRTKTWLNTRGGLPPKLLGRPRLIRFFMDQCNYCRATAPALNRIHREYRRKGLQVVGIFHPKPSPREVTFEELRRAVVELELGFPVTVDPEWQYLNKLWRDTGQRAYTSASFLIDRKGVIRFVHPGPEFFPSRDPAKAQQNADYKALRQAIEKVLNEE